MSMVLFYAYCVINMNINQSNQSINQTIL